VQGKSGERKLLIGLAKDLAAEGVVDRGVAERCLIDDALSDFLDFSKVRMHARCFIVVFYRCIWRKG
jgi:hypothetical protein